MRIVKQPFLKMMAVSHPQAALRLETFRKTVRKAHWKNITEMRQSYPHADMTKVASKRTVVILNVAGNKYRLILAIHFDKQKIFTLRFLTHAEYSQNTWRTTYENRP